MEESSGLPQSKKLNSRVNTFKLLLLLYFAKPWYMRYCMIIHPIIGILGMDIYKPYSRIDFHSPVWAMDSSLTIAHIKLAMYPINKKSPSYPPIVTGGFLFYPPQKNTSQNAHSHGKNSPHCRQAISPSGQQGLDVFPAIRWQWHSVEPPAVPGIGRGAFDLQRSPEFDVLLGLEDH